MSGKPGDGRKRATINFIGQDVSDDIAFPLAFERLKANTRIDPVSGCWLWTKYIYPTGYAQMSFRCRQWRAHRLMYMVAKGPVGNLHVMHSCDVRNCINPEHLSLGTNEENIHDALRKGRPHRGNLMSQKTHCPSGHPYAETARWDKGRRNVPKRSCTVCQRIIQRKKAGWPDALLNLPPQKLGQRPSFEMQREAK
jgi:hypothetical protein